jgi:hypothetical protein
MPLNLDKKKIEFKKPEQKKASSAEDATSDYVQRAKAEQKRYKDAVDGNIELLFCFKRESEIEAFRKLFNLPAQKFITGADFRVATEGVKPDKQKRGFAHAPKSDAYTPDPFQGVNFSGNLPADGEAIADAMLAAFRAVKRPDPCTEATDSDIWLCVVFDSSEDRQDYLAQWNLIKYGDRYMDGSAWLKALTA